jgi:hypothetical protein
MSTSTLVIIVGTIVTILCKENYTAIGHRGIGSVSMRAVYKIPWFNLQ